MTIIIRTSAHHKRYVYTTKTRVQQTEEIPRVVTRPFPRRPDTPRSPDGRIRGCEFKRKKGYVACIVLIINSKHILCVSSSAAVKKKTNPSLQYIILCTYRPTSSTTKRHLVTLEIMSGGALWCTGCYRNVTTYRV